MCYNTNITVKNPDTETTLDLRPPIWIDLKKHLKINFKTAKLHIWIQMHQKQSDRKKADRETMMRLLGSTSERQLKKRQI